MARLGIREAPFGSTCCVATAMLTGGVLPI